MVDLIGLSGFYARLRKACDEAGGQSAFARKHGLSPQYVSDAINARRDPGPVILSALGLVKVVAFQEAARSPAPHVGS